MRKRIFTIILSICMVLMLMPISANAMEIYVDLSITGETTLTLEVESGDSIDNVKEKIKNKTGYPTTQQTLKYGDRVLENGHTLADYNIQKEITLVLFLAIPEGLQYTNSGNEVTITGYNGSATEISIPATIDEKPVTAIGQFAFFCSELTSITIPSSVTSIESDAFHSCSRLTSINIPGKVTTIGSDAFLGCGSLTSITVDPNNSNYSSVDGVLFNKDTTELIRYPAGNTSASYSIPDSVTSIRDNAFRFSRNLKSVTFGVDSQLQSIGADAFNSCSGLESINIPNSVTSIGEQAFMYCSSLKSITIPNNVTVIKDRTFSWCDNLESIFLSDKVSGIGTAAIPDVTSNIKYHLDEAKGEVTFIGIDLGTDKTAVAIPAEICGYPVVAAEEGLLENISSHTCAGGQATCRTKATCGICKTEYGELDSSNHNLENIPAKAATVTETGNKEYWHCKDCGKYFSDKDGKNSIDLKDTVTQKLPTEIIEGIGQSLSAGEAKELTFRSNAAFGDFIRVELDGKTLDAADYTVKEGSTIITLKADYVGALSSGEHTISIVSTSGTATTTFTINAKTKVDNNTKSPRTGDYSHMILWIALLFVGGGLLTVTGVYGKKHSVK